MPYGLPTEILQNVRRRGLLFVCALPLLILTSTTGCQEKAKNIVIINVDTLRGDRLGFNGYERDTSPFLDRLAGEAAVYRQSYSTWPQTKPSVASIMTGHYPTAHGTTKRPDISLDFATFAEAFQAAGYETAAVVTNPHLSPGFGFDQGFNTYAYIRSRYAKSAAKNALDAESEIQQETTIWERKSEGVSRKAYASGDSVNEAALDWLDQTLPVPEVEVGVGVGVGTEAEAAIKNANAAQPPFLLYLHYMDVHNPYVSPEPYHSMFVEEPGKLHDLNKNLPPETEVTETDLNFMNAIYDGQIRFTDALIQDLFQELDKRGKLEDTLVVFMSDHGEEFLDHGGFGHGANLYRELTHVPLFFWGAAVLPGVHDQIVSTIDVFPTILELAGLPSPPNQGTNLARQIRKGSQVKSENGFVLSECNGTQNHEGRRRPQISAIDDDWYLLYRSETGEAQLFSQHDDPKQEKNLAEEFPEITRALADKAKVLLEASSMIGGAIGASPAEYDQETIDQLRALGYLSEEDDS